MDLREKKTKRSITNAFLQIRSKKSLEKITVKELSELAEISKATFYLHYRDIYDLSEKLQNEIIKSILSSIVHPEYLVTNHVDFTLELFNAFYAQQSLIEILFSGKQSSILAVQIEKELKNQYKNMQPNYDCRYDILLTYTIQGAVGTFQKYIKEYDGQTLIDLIGKASDAVMQIVKNQIAISL